MVSLIYLTVHYKEKEFLKKKKTKNYISTVLQTVNVFLTLVLTFNSEAITCVLGLNE